uniref:ribose-phosphate diphosphokinase n=1 Tax=Ditylum brightwellii TaxID=49249 RepID=A0A6S9A353_9STRA|mmetsp:Transcript_33692/g.50261  ORF Transcript_33692/g.50261 Transcript_33692/m.50261 type:complete len:480 (+) Transcript_33692:144-1583(+)
MSVAAGFARRFVMASKVHQSPVMSSFKSISVRAASSQSNQHARTASSSSTSYFAAVAAAAGAATLGGASLVLCEQSPKVKDPMTRYATYAAAAQQKEEQQFQQQHVEETENKKPQNEEQRQPTFGATSPIKEASSATPAGMTAQEARLEAAAHKAKRHAGGLKVFSGNGNMALALEISKVLGVNLGRATVGRFADGECNVMIHENVRGKDCYIIQPTCPPVNDNIMELLLMVSTLNRASARRVTVVIPYYGYARQDRKMQARVPISAADVARLLEAMGVDRVIAVDLHCGQIQGFFGPRVPVDNLDGGIVGIDHFGGKDLHNPVVVSPDAGGVYRAKKFKEGLMHKYEMDDIGLAMIIKQRARAGTVDQMDLVGDVNDCDCIIVDDMIDTAGTLCKAADVLVSKGARRVFAFASHGLLSGPGNDRIANSSMEECVILNTIPSTAQRQANEKLVELSVAPLLAQSIFNIHAKKSISALFK